ncbi:hypothetical protein [Pseudoalteromonas phenolica]|uniref:hypothetical protein n=1 Tax=Pseudoalteromonas phenolica TaxID=161398 RepID=UPI0038507976
MLLLLTGLLDVVLSHRKKIDGFKSEAISKNQLHLVRYCKQSCELVDSIIELWSALTEEERILYKIIEINWFMVTSMGKMRNTSELNT